MTKSVAELNAMANAKIREFNAVDKLALALGALQAATTQTEQIESHVAYEAAWGELLIAAKENGRIPGNTAIAIKV